MNGYTTLILSHICIHAVCSLRTNTFNCNDSPWSGANGLYSYISQDNHYELKYCYSVHKTIASYPGYTWVRGYRDILICLAIKILLQCLGMRLLTQLCRRGYHKMQVQICLSLQIPYCHSYLKTLCSLFTSHPSPLKLEKG